MKQQELESNPVVRHSFDFAVLVERYCADLYQLKKFDLARQLFRAGTSIGANIFEAQHPESNADFVHKLKIAQKEANETLFWLLLCQRAKTYPETKELLNKLEEINRLLNAIISTAKKKFPLGFVVGTLWYILKPATAITLLHSNI